MIQKLGNNIVTRVIGVGDRENLGRVVREDSSKELRSSDMR